MHSASPLAVYGWGLALRPFPGPGQAAARLAKLTGLDPLTIDQSTLEEGCVTCARIAKQMKKPVVFFHASRPLITGQYDGAVDLQVFKPSTERIAGRPGWLLEIGREPFPVPRNLLPTSGRRLVQAFVTTDSADAVPVDQFIVTAGQRLPQFMLPSAPMRFAFQERESKPR